MSVLVITDDEWIREAYIERAGILEYMAGVERKEAERLARIMVMEELRRTTNAD